MIQIKVDEEIIRKMCQTAIEEKLDKVNMDLVFWDSKELMRRTGLSWNTMQEHFFHHPGFPKTKIGSKWFFPAKETEEILTKWLHDKINSDI